ncbi:MAG TPA: ABC transporter substrate-binding protein [Gemmatimonadales bacterium]|nr:ABC transporter substrate-binding protein [Gemmatimonadales bacterium]
MTRSAPPYPTLLLLALLATAPAAAQRAPTSIVIVTGGEPTMPIPTLMEGPQSNVANFEVADHLFLRLANLGPGLITAGDRGFVPMLARSWSRRDSVTLVFELDPRARWHDGAPVTSRDVVFAFARARDAAIAPKLATLTQNITAVEADGDHRVIVRFRRPYAEQLYDATWHVAPLPSHLLARLSPEALARSAFVEHPIGDGPYRWVRRVPGEFIELAADTTFFLGRPGIDRVIIRSAADADARLNLLLSGQADAMDNVPPPTSNLQRVGADPDIRLVPVPSSTLGFLLFNQRARRDSTRPHPILADADVRRALVLALDRQVLVRAVMGEYGEVPFGPASPLLWIRHGAGTPLRQDREAARRLLAARGWADHDRDGVLDRNGVPLALALNYPGTSAVRRTMAQLIQEQYRQVGVRVDLAQFEFPVYLERRDAGDFDIDFSSSVQDPSPSGLTQSWTCAGGTNRAHYCDPAVDSLITRAIDSQGDTGPLWKRVLQRIEQDAPAAFIFAPTYVYAVNRRYRDVTIRPESSWIGLWRWSVGPASGRQTAGY